ncbi:glycosyltransferase [Rhodopirellula halodulae]|uniref:glycosyltransferase n=1 Tax=Rhodopirellula halodulae TaxID=2894198 RepID=UPI001E3D79FE|nr:glycosyltransferase [Rhodopirellula sp. JC737]MCC9655679.1 glycosyltransferase [Rhodopirellula sp. JC737]
MKLKGPRAIPVQPAPQSLLPSSRYRRLRVAIVSDAIAGRNGLGTYYMDLIEHLRGHVGCIELLGPTADRDAQLERFSIPMPGDKTQRMVYPNRCELRRRLDDLRPNLVIVPTLGAFSYFALQYAREKRIPVAIAHHTNFDRLLSLYWPRVISKPLGWMLRKVNRWLITQAGMVVSLNSEAYQDAVSLGARNVRIMGTPVACDFLRHPQSHRNDPIRRVIFVGRLAAEKGVGEVLDAAAIHSKIQFAIAGDGPGRGMVCDAAERLSNVSYLGWLSRDRVREEIDQNDVLVLPSAIEAFGTVALEALARRRYVLLRRECGIAKWPSLAAGLFHIESNETVADSLDRMLNMTSVDLERQAEPSWSAVQDFNHHTLRKWLSFLADAAIGEAPMQQSDAA